MPECLDCGNTAAFRYEVEGPQVWLFDERGEFITVEYNGTETVEGPWCHECGSITVEIE